MHKEGNWFSRNIVVLYVCMLVIPFIILAGLLLVFLKTGFFMNAEEQNRMFLITEIFGIVSVLCTGILALLRGGSEEKKPAKPKDDWLCYREEK